MSPTLILVMPPARVLLAESNSLVRSLLRVALSQPGITVIGETATLDELLELCDSERPDVIVTNVDLDGGSIDQHIHVLAAPGTRILVVTDEPSPERLTALLGAGVSGYLLRDMGAESLVDAVRHVAAGQIALHPVAASTVVDQWKRLRDGGHRVATGSGKQDSTVPGYGWSFGLTMDVARQDAPQDNAAEAVP